MFRVKELEVRIFVLELEFIKIGGPILSFHQVNPFQEARWTKPHGFNLNRQGLLPDLDVPQPVSVGWGQEWHAELQLIFSVPLLTNFYELKC